MTAAVGKLLGWSYSKSVHLISQNAIPNYLSKNAQLSAYISSQSQFIGKGRKQEIQKKKKRYLNRLYSLDPNHDLDMTGK